MTAAGPEGLRVRCGDGEVAIVELQPESRRRMSAAEFLAGHPLKVGDRLR